MPAQREGENHGADLTGTLQRHSMIAVRTGLGVRFADYGGRFLGSLSELAQRGGIWVARGGSYSVASSGGMGSAVLVKGMAAIGAMERYASAVFRGSMLLVQGVTAIETPDGVDVALPVTSSAAIEKGAHEPELLAASFDAFKARKAGTPLARLRPISMRGRRHGPPRPGDVTGVQYRLNAAGFGAGPVDGRLGPRTRRAVLEFQRTYALVADGVPGPKTQGRLVEICGF